MASTRRRPSSSGAMAMPIPVILGAAIILTTSTIGAREQLRMGFYDESCPGGADRPAARPPRPHCRRRAPQEIASSGMTEAPFFPRERLFKQQQYFQNLTKHTHRKGRYDVITSVGIPLALAASSLFLIGRGIYNMSHGNGKKE